MKVKLEERYREFYTLEDLDRAKMVIAAEKDDEETAAGWAEYAAQHIVNRCFESDGFKRILEATAATAKNYRVWDDYGDGTGNLDVWITFTARTWDGFIEGGAYLTDIWSVAADNDLTNHMYFQYFKRS